MDSAVLRLVSSSALQALLDKIVGPKTLVLAPNLAGPLGLITEVGLLKVRLPSWFSELRGADECPRDRGTAWPRCTGSRRARCSRPSATSSTCADRKSGG